MPKNVIILHTDQQRYDSLGCCGDPSNTTPNIDVLAAEGCVGHRHITANPVCEPSRASLFTGLYPQAHGVWGNGVALNRREFVCANTSFGNFQSVIEPMTMADMFANAGYDTVSLGKLHLTPNLAPAQYNYPECWEIMARAEYDNWHGPYFGFRHVELTLGHGEQPCHGGHYGHWLAQHHPDVLARIKEQDAKRQALTPSVGDFYAAPEPWMVQPVIPSVVDLYSSPVPAKYHNSAWLAERATAYLQQDRPRDKPFFLFVGFPDPHHPFTPSSDVLDALGEFKCNMPIDPQGKGLDSVPQGLIDHCRYKLSSEQWQIIRRYTAAMIHQVDAAVGRIIQAVKQAKLWDETVILFTSDHGDYLGDHGLLRKSNHADKPLVHVPFILRAPRICSISLPKCFDQPMSNVDVMPSLAQLAGIEIPQCTQGRPLSEILADDDSCAYSYCNTGKPHQANYSLFSKRYRLTWYPHENRCALFDHQLDVAEVNDLGNDSAHRELVQQLLARLKDHALRCTNPIGARVSPW